jgi:hypothetical protein
MKSKLSLLVLLVEIAAIIILHAAKNPSNQDIQASEKQSSKIDLASRQVKHSPVLSSLNN